MKTEKITEKTAISILNSARPRKGSYERLQKALDMAIKALNKQIPKKVIRGADGTEHCPCCDLDNSSFGYGVCINCGQAIDWSE